MGCGDSKAAGGADLGGRGQGSGGGRGGGRGGGGGDRRGDVRGGGGGGGQYARGDNEEEDNTIRIRKEPPMQLGQASSDGLRDAKAFSSAQFESTSEYDYLFKILLLGTFWPKALFRVFFIQLKKKKKKKNRLCKIHSQAPRAWASPPSWGGLRTTNFLTPTAPPLGLISRWAAFPSTTGCDLFLLNSNER